MERIFAAFILGAAIIFCFNPPAGRFSAIGATPHGVIVLNTLTGETHVSPLDFRSTTSTTEDDQ